MAVREGNWWSRAWGTVAVLGFALGLGAAVYEAVLVAPLWSLSPPESVVAWISLTTKPDSATLFDPLVAVTTVAATMAWLSGLTTRGWRRAWLTLALLAAGAWAALTFSLLLPCERQLFGAASLQTENPAFVIELTGEWVRIAALRFAALLVGVWTAYRAQLSGMLGDLAAQVAAAQASAGGSVRRHRDKEFAFGDEDERGGETPPKATSARERWQGSLPKRRRTAKK